MMEKTRKMIQKWIQNWSQEPLKIEKIEVQDVSKFLSFFSTVFLTRFFDFLAKMCDFGLKMGPGWNAARKLIFSLCRVWAPGGAQGRPRERRNRF